MFNRIYLVRVSQIFDQIYHTYGQTTTILLILGVILIAGFLMTRICKLIHIPYVSGYIIAGILIGPSVLNFVPKDLMTGMNFVSDIALAFIAFGVGKFFRVEVLKKTGIRVIFITIMEALVAGIVITFAMHFIFRLDWNFSLILGAIATATAPASTTMTIRQYDAKGEFVDTLLQVVALDDVVCLLAFSVVAAICGRSDEPLSFMTVMLPIIHNVVLILVGALCGYILSKILTVKRSQDNRLILVIAMLLLISGLCGMLNISPLLSCMIFGAVYINLTQDQVLYNQINNFSPPILSIFFILSGMNLDLKVLGSVGLIGLAYFIIRILGKYLGSFLGCRITNQGKDLEKYLGLALIPQAGVAIGLAFLGVRMLPPEMGNLLMTIILASSVLYELIGPVCAKIALIKSGAISKNQFPINTNNHEELKG